MNMPGYFVDIGIFVAGLLASFFVNYFTLAKEFAYIKGQLAEILKNGSHIDDLIAKYAILEKDQSTTHERLNYLERQFRLNGGYHGTSS